MLEYVETFTFEKVEIENGFNFFEVHPSESYYIYTNTDELSSSKPDRVIVITID